RLIETDIGGFEVDVKRGLGEEGGVPHHHPELVLTVSLPDQPAVDHSRLVDFLVAAIVADHRDHVGDPGVRNEGRADPIMNQTGGDTSWVCFERRPDDNLAGAFVRCDPDTGPPSGTYRRRAIAVASPSPPHAH